MAKYDPLSAHLSARRENEITLSFAEIEALVGALPKSADRPQWWANEAASSSTHLQARAWLKADFRASPQLAQRRVRFTRR